MISLFEKVGFRCIVSEKIIRTPSYSFDLINTFKITFPWAMPIYRWIEALTISRKQDQVASNYYIFSFEK
jgi:hypothetical protein